jgi:hypothetical protein
MRFVVVTSVDEVGELLLHLFHVVVEGDLGRSCFSLVGVVSMMVMDKVRKLLFHLLHVVVKRYFFL